MSELDDRPQGFPDGGGRPGATLPAVLGPVHPLDDDVLRRHRSKVLRPEEAVPAWDGTVVRPTIYRPDWMLLPAELVRAEPEFLASALRQIELTIPQQSRPDIPNMPGTFPVPVQLRAAPPVGLAPARPIDAWHALQAIRAAAAAQTGERRPRLVELARRASLDHVACSVAPTLLGQRSVIGTPGASPHGGGTDRLPVRLPLADALAEALAEAAEKALAEGRSEAEANAIAEALGAPARPTPTNGRRPVVAVLDTGCGSHPWLPKGPGDPFVEVQSPPITPWPDAEQNPSQVKPLIGELDRDAGHGTFITGILRQVAPGCRVLMYPAMYGDGTGAERDILTQLERIHQRVLEAVDQNDDSKFIDVVSMSFGWYPEGDTASWTASVQPVIEALSDLGVVVVASAGNDAADDPPLYPAALSQLTRSDGTPRVLSVGALTNRTSKAIFSNEGSWVNAWYEGCALVSTLPTIFNGSGMPPQVLPGRKRAGFDPDGFSSGFGTWGGTSFSAAQCSADVAAKLSRESDLSITGSGALDRSGRIVRDIMTTRAEP